MEDNVTFNEVERDLFKHRDVTNMVEDVCSIFGVNLNVHFETLNQHHVFEFKKMESPKSIYADVLKKLERAGRLLYLDAFGHLNQDRNSINIVSFCPVLQKTYELSITFLFNNIVKVGVAPIIFLGGDKGYYLNVADYLVRYDETERMETKDIAMEFRYGVLVKEDFSITDHQNSMLEMLRNVDTNAYETFYSEKFKVEREYEVEVSGKTEEPDSKLIEIFDVCYDNYSKPVRKFMKGVLHNLVGCDTDEIFISDEALDELSNWAGGFSKPKTQTDNVVRNLNSILESVKEDGGSSEIEIDHIKKALALLD